MSILRLRKSLLFRALNAVGAAQLAMSLVCLGAVTSVLVFADVSRHYKKQQQIRQDHTFLNLVEDITARFEVYAHGLRSLRNFVGVETMPALSRRSFESFANSNDAASELAGARGIGVVRYLRPSEVEPFLQERRTIDGVADFAIKQINSHDGLRYVVQHVTPAERNAGAVGFDLSSEPVRAAAAITAVARNRPTLSGSISVVQANGEVANELLMLLPVFKSGAPTETVEERLEALDGWTYSPLVVDEALADIAARYKEWHLRIVDERGSASGVLYDTLVDAKEVSPPLERSIQIHGRQWHITGATRYEGMTAIGNREPYVTAAVTFVLFALIAWVVYVSTRHLARQQQLSAEHSRLADIVAHASDAILSIDLEGRIMSWNGAARRLFRMSEAEAHLSDIRKLIEEQLEPVFASIKAGRELPDGGISMKTMCTAKDGSRFPGTVSIFALGNGVGHLGVSVRDMSEQQAFEECILELTHKLQAEVKDRTSRLDQSLSQQAEIHHLAMHDPLTGLANRTLFRERLQAAVALHASDPSQCFALLALDLDRFKPVNDTYGHPVGDVLLVQIGERLRACLAPDETAARLGGDEFAILLKPGTSKEAALATTQRVLSAIETPFEVDGIVLEIGVSIGLAFLDDTMRDVNAEEWFKLADHALYMAKRDGRGRYHVCEDLQDAHGPYSSRIAIEMREALRREEFRLVYQPIIDCAMSRLDGFEALVRWDHPVRGPIAPSEFIRVAEETEQIVAIGEWVMRMACTEAAKWDNDMTISVNVSPVQIKRPGWDDSVIAVIKETGLDPGRVIIEVTETVLITESGDVLASLKRLQDHGISIALDDFGTGYSSLSYLRRFRFDKLKIDKSFMRDSRDIVCASIIRCIVRLGRQLSMTVVAEGIETEQQLKLVEREGCSHAQGFYFAKPMPAVAVPAYIATMRERQSSGLRQSRLPELRKTA